MKSRTTAVVVLLAALCAGMAFSQDPAARAAAGQDPVAERLEKVEADLATAKLRIESLSTELSDIKTKMGAAAKYADGQAKAAAEMMDILDQAEREGFTYGINPDSRHTLLRGWRDQLAAAQKDVPEVEAPPPPAPVNGKRAPRKP
jgi:cobalamin biosynthesis protein CobT